MWPLLYPAFSQHMPERIPAKVHHAASKNANPSVGRVTRFTPRRSCSTILQREIIPKIASNKNRGVLNLLSGSPDAHLVCDLHPMRTPSANR